VFSRGVRSPLWYRVDLLTRDRYLGWPATSWRPDTQPRARPYFLLCQVAKNVYKHWRFVQFISRPLKRLYVIFVVIISVMTPRDHRSVSWCSVAVTQVSEATLKSPYVSEDTPTYPRGFYPNHSISWCPQWGATFCYDVFTDGRKWMQFLCLRSWSYKICSSGIWHRWFVLADIEVLEE